MTAIRVLLVEDEQSILFALQRYFVHLGWSVDSADNLYDAFERLGKNAYEVIVTDLLGKNEGLELISCARERSARTRIVLFTSHDPAEIGAEARRLGADAVLRKPLALSEVAQVVYSLLAINNVNEFTTSQPMAGQQKENP